MTLRQAAVGVGLHDRKGMPCLLFLVLSSVTVTLITAADASYFLS